MIASLKSQHRSDLCHRASDPNNSLRCVQWRRIWRAWASKMSNFHSSSAILKIEWQAEPQSFSANVQPFLSPVSADWCFWYIGSGWFTSQKQRWWPLVDYGVWRNFSSMRRSVSSPGETPRRELKIRRAARLRAVSFSNSEREITFIG